jgi:ribosomal protein L21E
MSTFLRTFKIGDIVDIVANSSEQKGLPHKCECGGATLLPCQI